MAFGEEARILADLERHAGLFDLSRGLGDDLVEIAVTGVLANFEAELDPDDQPWPELSPDYGRWKGHHYPGEPIGVQKGRMRSGIRAGDRSIEHDSASWTYGDGQDQIELASYFQEGDPAQNRPERRFADLTRDAVKSSDRRCDKHFDEGTR